MSIIPVNREQAYGTRVAAALRTLRESYDEIALMKDSPLCGEAANRLDCAVMALKELFPDLPDVNAYGGAKKLIPELNYLFNSLVKSADSTTRLHFQAFCRARLYAGTPRLRVSDLQSDPELRSIASNADMLPLALVLGEHRDLVVGNVSVSGMAADIPENVLDGGRPFQDFSDNMISYLEMQRRIDHLGSVFGQLANRSAWSCFTSSGNTTGSTNILAAAAWNNLGALYASYEECSGAAEFAQFILTRIPAANGDYRTWMGVDNHHSGTFSGYVSLGNGVLDTLNLQQRLWSQISQAGEEAHFCIFTYDSVPADVYTNIGVSIDASAIQPIVRNGSTSATLAFTNNVFVDYAEYETGHAQVKAVVITIRGLAVGQRSIDFAFVTDVPAAAQLRALGVFSAPPTDTRDRRSMSDAEMLEAVKDLPMTSYMREFLRVRTELAKSVREAEWLKSYHRYIFGQTQAYVDITPLTNAQVASVKARMLLPATWSGFSDLQGFLEKIYDDLGSLKALSQSTAPN